MIQQSAPQVIPSHIAVTGNFLLSCPPLPVPRLFRFLLKLTTLRLLLNHWHMVCALTYADSDHPHAPSQAAPAAALKSSSTCASRGRAAPCLQPPAAMTTCTAAPAPCLCATRPLGAAWRPQATPSAPWSGPPSRLPSAPAGCLTCLTMQRTRQQRPNARYKTVCTN